MMCRNNDFVSIAFANFSFNKVSAFFMFSIEPFPGKKLFTIANKVEIAYVTLRK